MAKKDIKAELALPCSPQEAYDAWLDSKKHGEMIGATAKIDPKAGGKFDIWDNCLIGETLELDPKAHKIIQSWRDNSTDWSDGHYSKIVVEFKNHKGGTLLKFTQTGVPEAHIKSIEDGWKDYYWDKMKKYFAK